MGKVLVVGGAGYLGFHIAELLGERAVVYDNLLYATEYLENYEFVYGDVRHYRDLEYALQMYEYDAVVWLAAIVGDAACAHDPAMAMEVNVDSVSALVNRWGKRVIFTSTCSVYGAGPELATESTPTNPLSIYAETKLRAEEHLTGHDHLILRLGTLHGASRRMRFDLMVNAMTLSAFSDQIITIFGGSQRRPLISVFDVASLIAKMTKPDFEAPGGVYNVASENASVTHVGHNIAHCFENCYIEQRAINFEDERDYSVDFSKAMEHLGYVPSYGYLGSARHIYSRLESRRIKDPYDPRYYNIRALGGGNGT